MLVLVIVRMRVRMLDSAAAYVVVMALLRCACRIFVADDPRAVFA